MNKRQHEAETTRLTGQLEIAKKVVDLFASEFELSGLAKTGGLEDVFGDAWNAAHDAVTALEAMIRQHELEGYGRNSRSYRAEHSNGLAELVAQNID